MSRGVVALAVMALFAVPAGAGLSDEHLSFMDGPAGYLATRAELKAYAKLGTDAEAARFVELFWAKRDPDLTTAVNEFKVEFDQRVAAADAQFGGERGRGAMSDRGRTLVVMGRPFAVSHRLPESMVHLIGERDADQRGGVEVWTYRGEQVPASVKAHEVYFVFVESRLGANDYPLDRGERQNGRAMKLLADAPERLLLHPDLEEVPRVGLVAGSRSATPAELAVLAVQPRPWPEGAEVRAAQGVRSAALLPLWIHVRVPDPAPAATGVVGRAVSAAGADGGTFSAAATAVPVPGGRAYEVSLPLAAGAWKVELALLAGNAPVAVAAVDATLEAAPVEGSWISPLYYGAEVRQESLASLGDPFNVGGWHVIPQPGDRYRAQESVGYFCMVVRPGRGADGQPAFETRLAFYQGDAKLTETAPEPAALSRVDGDLWMFGASLPVAAFRAAGEYRVDVTVRDTVAGVERTTRVPVVVGP